MALAPKVRRACDRAARGRRWGFLPGTWSDCSCCRLQIRKLPWCQEGLADLGTAAWLASCRLALIRDAWTLGFLGLVTWSGREEYPQAQALGLGMVICLADC